MAAPHTPLLTRARPTLAAAGSETPPNGRRHKGRAVLLVVVLAATALGWALTQGAVQPSRPPIGAVPRATSGPTPPATARAAATTALTWQPFAGLDLPVSATAGPRDTADGRAKGFTQDDDGAALAAVHLLVRTFPFAGPKVFEPTIAEQVTGRDAATLSRLTRDAYDQVAGPAGVDGGAPIPSEDGWVAGYQLDPPTATAPGVAAERTVRVLIRQASAEGAAGFTEYTVHLQWRGGDWALVAPRWGDWRTQARAISDADPAQYRSYDQIGRP